VLYLPRVEVKTHQVSEWQSVDLSSERATSVTLVKKSSAPWKRSGRRSQEKIPPLSHLPGTQRFSRRPDRESLLVLSRSWTGKRLSVGCEAKTDDPEDS